MERGGLEAGCLPRGGSAPGTHRQLRSDEPDEGHSPCNVGRFARPCVAKRAPRAREKGGGGARARVCVSVRARERERERERGGAGVRRREEDGRQTDGSARPTEQRGGRPHAAAEARGWTSPICAVASQHACATRHRPAPTAPPRLAGSNGIRHTATRRATSSCLRPVPRARRQRHVDSNPPLAYCYVTAVFVTTFEHSCRPTELRN